MGGIDRKRRWGEEKEEEKYLSSLRLRLCGSFTGRLGIRDVSIPVSMHFIAALTERSKTIALQNFFISWRLQLCAVRSSNIPSLMALFLQPSFSPSALAYPQSLILPTPSLLSKHTTTRLHLRKATLHRLPNPILYPRRHHRLDNPNCRAARPCHHPHLILPPL